MNSKPSDNYVQTVLLLLACFCGLLLVVIVYGGDVRELLGRTNKLQVRFFVMLAGALLLALLAHAFLRRWSLACLASGAAFSLVVHAIGFLSLGHLDPFFPITLAVDWFLGLVVAAPVGLCFHLVRSRSKQS